MQEIVCGCMGKDGVENMRSCRCESPALIQQLRSKDHLSSPMYKQTIHWPSHNVYSKDLVEQQRQDNVNLAKVYIIIGSFFGSMKRIPFTKRALKNLCGRISREQGEDDVRKTMEAFAELVQEIHTLHIVCMLTKIDR
ncbi:hypothetical protein VPH35_101616 [Triticum aestivum]|uniref:Uncharacterized protein n=2 Tax=Aegilops tauschii subsp. strangulata TaxID=200361 RepID=A0A453MI09_AEGTS